MSIEAGWYPDPGGGEGLRYWDGENWTAEHSPQPSVPGAPATAQMVQPAGPKVPTPLLVIGGIVALIIAGVVVWALTSGGEDSAEGGSDSSVDVEYSLLVSEPCWDLGLGYSDISAGTQVEVFDGSGALLGFGTLGSGEDGGASCTFSSSFDISRSTDGIYRITAGGESRGFLNYTEDDLLNDTLTVQATLG